MTWLLADATRRAANFAVLVKIRAALGNPAEGERDSGLKPNTIPL